MTDLRDLTVDSFSERIGETFVLVEGDARLAIILEEAESVGGSAERAGFSLVFAGPSSPVAGQGTYRLEHAELGELDLFLVPVALGRYQAIFA